MMISLTANSTSNMSYPMSLQSASPFHYQLAKQTCAPADLWPDFKLPTTEVQNISKPKETQQDTPQSALDRAFIAASEALKGGSIQQRQAGWTSTKSLLQHHVRVEGIKATDYHSNLSFLRRPYLQTLQPPISLSSARLKPQVSMTRCKT